MQTADKRPRSLWQRLFGLLEAGFEVMARYPHDPSDLCWDIDLYDPPQHGDDWRDDDPHRPQSPHSGRTIKLMPAPASQRYQATRPRRFPAHRNRHKQPF